MINLEAVYNYAGDINADWDDAEKVDWSQAEYLIETLHKHIPKTLLEKLPVIRSILEYAAETEDWDSGEVGEWPNRIREELETADKQYGYEEDGESWEVFSLSLSGEREWKGTVETESIAEKLVGILAP